MAEVDEGAAWVIEGIMLALRVIVLILLLDPSEDLAKRSKLDLAISQANFFEAFLVALSPTLCLQNTDCHSNSHTRLDQGTYLAERAVEVDGELVELGNGTSDFVQLRLTEVLEDEVLAVVHDFRLARRNIIIHRSCTSCNNLTLIIGCGRVRGTIELLTG